MGHRHEGASGEDDHLEPERFQFGHVEQRGFAGFHEVVQQRNRGVRNHFRRFFGRPYRLDEQRIRPRFGEGVATTHGVVPAGDSQRVGADDDGEIVIGACVHGGVNLLHHLVNGHHSLVFQVAAALGELLVLDVHCRNARAFVFADGAAHVHGAAVSGVSIGDHRDAHRGSDGCRVGQHFGGRGQRQVGVADACHRGTGSGHVHGRKSGSFNDGGRQAIVSAGSGDDPGLGKQLSETGGGFHRAILASLGRFMPSVLRRWSASGR